MYRGLDSEEILIGANGGPSNPKKRKILHNLKVDVIKPSMEIINLTEDDPNDPFDADNEINKKKLIENTSTIHETRPPTTISALITAQTTFPALITAKTTIPAVLTSQTAIPPIIRPQATISTAITPQDTTQGIKKNTPKSGSHVRVLDFNFGAQNKCTTEKEQEKKTSSKCLFGKSEENEKSKKSEKKVSNIKDKKEETEPEKSWDSDLRATVVTNQAVVPKEKTKRSRARKPPKKEPPKEASAETEVDLEKNEAVVENPDKLLEEPILKDEKQEGKKQKNVTTRRARITAKQALSPTKIQNKREASIKENSLKIESEKIEVKNIEEVDVKENVIQNLQNVLKGTREIEISETLNLRNLNTKPKYHRKCNIDNNIKKEIKVTTVKEIRPIKFVSEITNKLILSPSKLNANKRTLVEAEQPPESVEKVPDIDPPKVPEIVELGNILENKPVEVDFEKSFSKLTPEIVKPDSSQPISAKCNITPFLETPMKFMEGGIPKTPGIFSPLNAIDTPITKTIKATMQGLDLSAIKTPQFPVTPDIPITPCIEAEFPNRSTDYSTSSSYYQPSDTEQNKCLQQFIIEECNRPGPVQNQSEIETKDKLVGVDNKTEKAIAEKMLTMNKNMIAKKNLNLVKQHAQVQDCLAFTDSSCSESSCSNWSSPGNISNELFGNTTVIEKSNNSKDTSITRYALRSQKNSTSFNECDSKSDTSKKISEILKNDNEISKKVGKIVSTSDEESPNAIKVVSKFGKKTATSAQQKLLTEMAEKRNRVINKLENEPKTKAKNPPKKVEPVAATRTVPKRSCKAAVKPKESIRQKSPRTRNKSLELALPKEKILHPFEVVETELLGASSSTPLNLESRENLESHPLKNFHKAFETYANNKPEAQHEDEDILVALKRRGIHLMPNTASRKSDESLNESNKSDGSKKSRKSSILDKLMKNEERLISENKSEKDGNKIQDTPSADEVFDIKTNTDCLVVIHDEKKEPKRRLSDYDFEQIKKGISAFIFLDDEEVEKTMTATNLDILLDLPEKLTSKKKKGKKKFSPLNVLYNDLVDSTEEAFAQQIISPLENLYEEKKKDYNKKKLEDRNKTNKPSSKICDSVCASEKQLKQCASDTELMNCDVSKTEEEKT